MRRVLGVVLMVDGLLTAAWFAGLLGSLSARDTPSVAAIVLRAATAVVAVTGGWLLTQRKPPGALLAAIAAVSAAAVVTAGVVWRLLPTNLDPSVRLPMVALYWAFALVTVVYGARARRRMPGGGPE